jgi:hypothetical protein
VDDSQRIIVGDGLDALGKQVENAAEALRSGNEDALMEALRIMKYVVGRSMAIVSQSHPTVASTPPEEPVG